jgi:hypothetical protein
MLPGKGNADDGDEQQGSKDQVNDRGVQPAAKQPDDITKKRETPHAVAGRDDPFTKRPEHKSGQFKTLETEGYTDDRYTQDKPAEDITQGGSKAAEDQPYKVPNKIHTLKILIF